MAVVIWFMAAVVVGTAAELPVLGSHHDETGIASDVRVDPMTLKPAKPVYLIGDNLNNNDPSCTFPFEPVGEFCFYFSEELRNYHGALEFCESLSQHETKVSLAILDYDEELDELLLTKVVSKQKQFWVGGSANDGINWKWEDGRDVYMDAGFWYRGEPNEEGKNCAIAGISSQGNNVRSYIYDEDCTEPLNFICQTGCPFEFEKIGQFCYFFSAKEGIPLTNWQDARDQCQSLAVAAGYHSDLAVLGRSDQDNYRLISRLSEASSYSQTWMGAFAATDCNFEWIDGRSFSTSSQYWDYAQPSCDDDVVYFTHDNSNNRTYFGDQERSYEGHSFICQLFKD